MNNKTRFTIELLKELCPNYKEIINKRSKNLTYSSIIVFMCSCCGKEVNKKFGAVKRSGPVCHKCAFNSKIYTKELLEELCPNYKEIDVHEKLNCKSQISFNCGCGEETKRTFESIKNKGALCYKCSSKSSKIFNKELLEKLCPNYTKIFKETPNISCESIIYFTCSCGEETKRKFSEIKRIGSMCFKCSTASKKFSKELLEELCPSYTEIIKKTHNINCESIIKFICQCGEETEKKFIEIRDTGAICYKCIKTSKKYTKELIEKLCLNYKEIINLDSNITYKSIIVFDCSCKKEGRKTLCSIEKTGAFCAECIEKNAREKREKTCIENFNTTTPFTSETFKQKSEETCLKKYGVLNCSSAVEVKKKREDTCMQNYNCKNPFGNKDIYEKAKKTMIEKYDAPCTFQSEILKSKIIQNNQKKYNCDYPNQNVEKAKEINAKRIITCQERYNVDHVMQNPQISEKSYKNAHKTYEYELPSGKIINLQGYEKYALDTLLETYQEDDIIIGRDKVPSIWYKTDDNKSHRYYTDFFISKDKKCIEVKSKWTYDIEEEITQLKKKACIDAKYLCEIWIITPIKKNNIVIIDKK
jgi:hypothetical protein